MGADDRTRQTPPSRTAEEPLLESAGPESGILPPEVSRELVEHYCGQEWAVYPDDVMLRRTGWRRYSTDPNRVAEQVAAWMEAGCAAWCMPPPTNGGGCRNSDYC